ncbi:MAG TPA: HD-GYP domain-containing protein [Nitrospira sp.]|nr:HD-GYP domain-containing protein [Nitrospira sp.]
MRKQISIDQLAVGMKIITLDKSWAETPFLRHRMRVTAAEQIEALRACGVRQLEVDVEVAADQPMVGRGEETIPEPPIQALTAKAGEASSVPLERVPLSPASFDEELPAARQAYRAAKAVIQQAMGDARMGRDINMEAVNQAVAAMADSVLRNPDALTSLSRLKRFDEYTFYHSVNTALLGIALGRSVGFSREALHRLGVGTLLHDIGKTRIPVEILNKPGRFEAHEFEVVQQHVLRGVELLAGTALADESMRPALEHHERVDGSGYPHRRKRTELSQFGLIAAIVDIYDAVTSDRCYHKAKPAHEALQYLYQLNQRGHVDDKLLQRFVRVVGVYPVGSCVLLNTGETALVRQLSHHGPLDPHILIVKSAGNASMARPEPVDLANQTRRPRRRIHAVVAPEAAGVDPFLYLDAEHP